MNIFDLFKSCYFTPDIKCIVNPQTPAKLKNAQRHSHFCRNWEVSSLCLGFKFCMWWILEWKMFFI